MSSDSSDGLATELEQVRGALMAWRATPGRGQRIPDAVWRKAVRAAKRHGLNPVSKGLGLDYKCLKQHVAESGVGGKRTVELTPTFVEVKPEAPREDVACVIEMEKGGVDRPRGQGDGAGHGDVVAVRVFPSLDIRELVEINGILVIVGCSDIGETGGTLDLSENSSMIPYDVAAPVAYALLATPDAAILD